MGLVADNLAAVRDRMVRACARADRAPESVELVAVTKTVGIAAIQEALAAGIRIIGENRVQEAAPKLAALGPGVECHLVGHLQTNKVRRALELFRCIQSVDSDRLTAAISRSATRPVELLIEVNTTGEISKFGARPADVPDLVARASRLPNLVVRGLMTLGPSRPDPAAARRAFRILRDLRAPAEDRIGRALPVLSMGMTSDFELAIEEGATMVRIGTAIFGARTSAVG